jgi:DNA-binding transcriptional LysR family regulator
LKISENAARLLPDLTTAFDGIVEAVNRITHQEQRTIAVSCLGTLTMRWLIPCLFDFQKKFPNIEVRITSDDGPVNFERRRIDLAIRVGTNNWGKADVEPLFKDRVGPVLSPEIMPSGGLQEPQSLATLALLHTRTRPDAWADWCKSNGISFNCEGRMYEHFYFMLEATVAGLGVAIAPDVLVRDDLSANRLIAPLGFVFSGQQYVVLTRKESSKDVLIFKNWLLSQAKGIEHAQEE